MALESGGELIQRIYVASSIESESKPLVAQIRHDNPSMLVEPVWAEDHAVLMIGEQWLWERQTHHLGAIVVGRELAPDTDTHRRPTAWKGLYDLVRFLGEFQQQVGPHLLLIAYGIEPPTLEQIRKRSRFTPKGYVAIDPKIVGSSTLARVQVSHNIAQIPHIILNSDIKPGDQ